jgi:hypothetical protein
MSHLGINHLPSGLLEEPDCTLFPTNGSVHSASGTPGCSKACKEDAQPDNEQSSPRSCYRPENSTICESRDPLLPRYVQVT